MSDDDKIDEVQRGFLRTALRIEDGRADLVTLARAVDSLCALLVDKGVLAADEIRAQLARASDPIIDKLNAESSRVRIRIHEDGGKYDAKNAEVDCAARIPVCKAACCSMQVPLGVEDLEEGQLRWQLDHPYLLLKDEDARCHYQDRKTGFCGSYDNRPRPCRTYGCQTDNRIWRDFEKMIPNEKGIAALLAQECAPALVPLRKTPPRR